MKTYIILLASILVVAGNLAAQTHFSFIAGTGSNATIGIVSAINPTIYGIPLSPGDEIGVFADGHSTPDSFCVGAAVWSGMNIALTVWGDNDQTTVLDGMKAGTPMRFRIWVSATNKEYTGVLASVVTGSLTYSKDAILQLASLKKDVYFKFQSQTGGNATIGLLASVDAIIGGTSLAPGDEIGVFADGYLLPDSFCVGAVTWTGANTVITVWGDNDQTPELDGIRPGTKMRFRVWKAATTTEYRGLLVTFSTGSDVYATDAICMISTFRGEVGVPEERVFPPVFELLQNFPNPFNPSTQVEYRISHPGWVRLTVFDILGRQVEVLVDEEKPAGIFTATWNAVNMSSGMYVATLHTEARTVTRKLLLLR